MRLRASFWLLVLPVATCLTIDKSHPKHTVTVTKTCTKTTTVKEPKGTWLPAKLTKHTPPHRANQKKARWEVPRIVKRDADAATKPTPSKKGHTVTVTKTVEATATAYAACKDHRNYVTNVAADGYSGVDGSCDCEAYTSVNSGDANNAEECCSLCWGDSSCIGSLWSPQSSDGSGGCFWISATSCGTYQGYSYIQYFNGTKYDDNKTVSNGPCGLAYDADSSDP